MSTTKKGCVFGLVALLGLLAVLGAGAYFYFFVVRVEPRAARHVPLGTTVALRADAVELLSFAPVREHLLPVLLDARRKEPAEQRRLRGRAHELTGVDLADAREVVIASVDATEWVVLVGGRIEPGRFVAGLEQLFAEEGIGGWRRDGDLLVHALGPAIGQAEDGVLVIATSGRTALTALPARDDEDEPELPLFTKGAIGFLISSTAWSGAIARLPATFGALDTLTKIERIDGALQLDAAPQVTARLAPKPGTTAEQLSRELTSSLATLKLAMAFAPDLGGAREAIAGATVTAEGDVVRMQAPWPYQPLEEATKRAAELLGALLARSPDPQ